MALTQARIRQIEKRVQKKQRQQGKSALVVPPNWADFARMVKIRSGGNVKAFNPYPYQIELVDLMLERSVVVCKSRQLGVSETITCFMLWRACQNPGYLGLVFSKTQTDSSLLARRMKRMIASLGLKTATENLSDIEIQGYGRILFRNSKPDSARGIESVVDVFLDELGFLETGKEVYDALAPAMQMVGDKARVFAVSTPNGKNGFYWELLSNGNGSLDIESICSQASSGEAEAFKYWVDEGGWGKVLIHWRSHPIYGSNPNFLEEVHEKQKLSWATIDQEYNLSFGESESNYFSADIIRKCAVATLAKYDARGLYFVGIDASTTGEDYAVGAVLKLLDKKLSLVQFYRQRRQTSEYHLFNLGRLIEEYHPQVVAIETTGGTGQVWLEALSKVYKNTDFQGIRTTGDSKPEMLDRVKLLLEKGELTYPIDSPLVDELLSFKRKGKKLESPSGKHDDLLMAVAFAVAVAPQKESWFDLSKLR
ncbi:hypothetical protein SD81_028275 [Tolypothrix campylonemoides VB511288]|nr:hypothetical protein SD81_028275 [Tolypothrix campylonemoides VB511288]